MTVRVRSSDAFVDDDVLAAFRALPGVVYRDDPIWAPEAESAVGSCFGRARAGQIEVRAFVADHDGEPVARAAAVEDPAARAGEGWVGLFECLQDRSAAGVAVLREAQDWLRERGAARAVGPRVDPLRAGLLVDGFHRPHTIFTAHNPARYLAIFEDAGFEIASRMHSFVFHRDRAPTFANLPGRTITIRHADLDGTDRELARIEEFQQAVFIQGIGHVARDEGGTRWLASQLLHVLDPELIVLAEDGAGALIGVLVCLPDAWQPPPVDRARLMSVGVSPGWRGKRVAMAMGARLAATLIGKGYQTLEGSWIMADNRRPQMLAKALGAEPGRVFALLAADLRR